MDTDERALKKNIHAYPCSPECLSFCVVSLLTYEMEVFVDNQGIVIPSAFQSPLSLSPGMTLVVEKGEKEEVRLRIQPETPTLLDKQGVLVVKAESLRELANVTRHERSHRVFELLQRVGL